MSDAEILPRHLSREIADALASARVVNIIGPRQVGKTTLVRDLLDQGRFLTLDDAGTLAAVETDAYGMLTGVAQGLTGPIIIDEAQRSKKIGLAIKRIVDEKRRPGQFVLTGSSNIFTTKEVLDSLAGRVRTLKLWPLMVSEVERAAPPRVLDWGVGDAPDIASLPEPPRLTRESYVDLILRGGYPETRALPIRLRQRNYRDYVDSVVDRDVADVARIRKTDALRRLIDQLAVRTAGEVNATEMAEAIGIQRQTLDEYLDLLARLSIVVKLGAWTSGETRREIKNAKYHFVDTGVACALRALTAKSFEPDANPTALGGLVESFVFGELLRSAPLQESDFRLYHWRGDHGREVDVLAESGTRLVAFEIKASHTLGGDDFTRLRWFAEQGPGARRNVTLVIFYFGPETLTFGRRAFALPISMLWAWPSSGPVRPEAV